MGGKTKQSQRTKNNVRPSSSGRSAELLNSSVKLDSSYIITGSGKVLPALFPTLTTTPIDQGLTPEYLVCFKKLHKKDPITKTKALQELKELVKNGNIEEVVVALPSWANVYQPLSVDGDRRVREAAQSCHSTLVSVCGRRVAPVLRRLLPAWLLASADDHGPAQAAALASLQNTFPDGKLSEAISFCKTEILSLLIDNLTGKAESMLSNKVEDAEERSMQVSRVLCCSLRALRAVLQRRARDPPALDELNALLADNHFWKLAAHHSASVRCSWYSCAGELYPALPAAGRRRVLRALLNTPEGGAAPFTAMLEIANRDANWHELLDKKDLLMKRIIGALENGGGGEARTLCESLRGLLASLPRDIKTREFWTNFLDAIFTGLNNKSMLSSKSERQSWISNLTECLKYLSMQNDEYVIEVISCVQRRWIETVVDIQDNMTRTNMVKYSARQWAILVIHWLKRSEAMRDDKYDQLVRNYWQNIGSTISSQIDKLSVERSDIRQLLESHTLIFKTFKTGYTEETKQQRSIKFADEDIETNQTEVNKMALDEQLRSRFEHSLHEVADKACCYYFDFAYKKQVSKTVFPSLLNLLEDFDSERLFLSIARYFDCNTVYSLHDKVLKCWLSEDTMRCETLVDILFMMIKYITEDELDSVYGSFQQFPPAVVERCARLAVSQPLSHRGATRRWLRGAVCAATLLALARRPSEGVARDLLLDCVAVDERGELLVGTKTVVGVLDVLSRSLTDEGSMSSAGELLTDLILELKDHLKEPADDAVLDMFQVALTAPSSPSCQASLERCLSARDCASTSAGAMMQARNFLYADLNKLDVGRIERVSSLCAVVLIPNENILANTGDIAVLCGILFDDTLRPQVPPEVYALRCDCIFGKINCPIEDDNDFIKTIVTTSDMEHAELSAQDFILFAYKAVFRSSFFLAMVTRNDNIIADVFFQEQYALCLYEYVIIRTLYDRYAFWDNYELIDKTKNHMDGLLDDIFTKTPYKFKASLLIYLSEQAATKGYYWSYATRLFDDKVKEYIKMNPENEAVCEDAQEADDPGVSKELIDSMSMDRLKDVLTGNGFFHSLQAERVTQRTLYMVMLRSVFAAHGSEPDVLRAALAAGWAAPHAPVDLYYAHNHVMLYDRELMSAPWSQIVSNAAIVDFLVESVENGWNMSAAEWDFTTITLCSLISSIRLTADCWECTKVSVLSRAVLQLLRSVSNFVRSLPSRARLEQPAPHVAALLHEWKDIFAPDINKNIFEILVIVLESADEHMTSSRAATIASLIEAAEHLDWDVIKTRTGEIELKNIARAAIDVLDRMTHHAYKYLAFHTLDAISKPMVLDDAEKLSIWSARDDDSPRPEFSLSYYDETLVRLQEMVDAALAHVQGVCGSVVEWSSAGARVSCSLLLLAAAVLRHAAAARTDLAHMYIELFRENKYAEWWMQTTLKLLPQEVAAFALEETDTFPEHCYKDFEVMPRLDVYGRWSAHTVSRLSCWVLTGALGGSGAGGARGWSLACPRTARVLQRLVPRAVTPPLVRRHLTQLRERAAELAPAAVSVRWTRGEARCSLDLDERELELTVRFAPSHPLAPPFVSTPANSPAPDTHWIVLYLAYQNGTLLNALKMWISAVTARVESSPQCYICYCRMHPASGRLPTVPCHQCRNKFHSPCLRKWFSTSNKSNCPLCRSKF